MPLKNSKEGWMEKNEVGCVVVVVQNSYIRIRKVLHPQKGSQNSLPSKTFLNLETFLDSGLKRRVCLPDKNPKGWRKRKKIQYERGMECEVND